MFDFWFDGETISIDMISLPRHAQGQGQGKEIMWKVCDIADEFGYPISLEAASYETFGGGEIGQEKLEQFYERFGFRKTGKATDEGYPVMVRPAETKAALTEADTPHTVGQTVLITDLYDTNELTEETEALAHACPPIYWDEPLTLRTMSASDAKNSIMAMIGNLTLWDAFERDASKKQKAIVNKKVKAFDHNRVVVLDGGAIVDGNHHVIAAIILDKPILYVDLGEW